MESEYIIIMGHFDAQNSISEQVVNMRWEYYRYHSLTRFSAGKQLWEFKDTSTEHVTKLDIPVWI